MRPRAWTGLVVALCLLSGACSKGGGSDDDAPTIVIYNPASADTYQTDQGTFVFGGSISLAGFVDCANVTTGQMVDGYVNYSPAGGTWFCTNLGLNPGANLITAVARGSSGSTAYDSITVTFVPPPPLVSP